MEGRTERAQPARRDGRIALAIGAATLMFYAVTIPGNHSEAEDAFSYAWDVEHNSARALLHSQHLFYGPLMKWLFAAAHSLRLVDRAYPAMLGFSLVCGGLAVALVFLLFRSRLDFPVRQATLVAAVVAASYGFWRYACETEIYVPATAAVLMALHAAAARGRSLLASVGAPLVGAAAVLLHGLAALPVLIGIPVLHAVVGRPRRAVLHVLVAGSIVATAYGVTGKRPTGGLERPRASERQAVARVVTGTIAFGQTIVSGNFLFGLECVRERVQTAYPQRMLAEEIYMGRAASRSTTLLAFLSLAGLIGAGLWVLTTLVRAPRRLPGARSPDLLRLGVLAAALAWLVMHAGVALWYAPGDPETWITAVPAFWVATALLAFPRLTLAGRRGLAVGAVCLLMHNWVGGMLPIASRASDYNVAKSCWLVAHARPGDLVVTAENLVFVRYLRYYSQAGVLELYGGRSGGPAEWKAAIRRAGGRVYATADVFSPPASMRARYPDATRAVLDFGGEVETEFRQIKADEFGGIFVCEIRGKKHNGIGPTANP